MKFTKIFIFSVLMCLIAGISFADYSFQVENNAKHGFYTEIIDLNNDNNFFQIESKSNYINAGGFLIEGNPSYTIIGNFAKQNIDLSVEIKDIITNVGGMHVQTGEEYNVTGKLGIKEIDIKIIENHPITKIGKMSVQSGFKKLIEKLGYIFESVSIVSNVAGFNVETDSYFKLTNKDKSLNLKISDFREDNFTISGNGSDIAIALCVALRPFWLL